ncbi:MAG: NUDIX domain-containing protein [Gammaproteobacteria bacterium]|nr:NUDIX domain-containing protein [Gammaproteobacteria bacterium]MBQ0841185.1 NUDIX domain-containing protein [Gammaproteobacteria bacterium]
MVKIQSLGEGDVELLSREVVYQGFFSMQKLHLRHRLFEGGWSREFTRELFVRGRAVGVLLYDPERQLVGMVEQFRVGAMGLPEGPWQLEVVAGIVEEGETSEDVANRELVEEAGIDRVKLLPICEYLVSPGGTNERLELFCGLADLRDKGGNFGLASENEDILLHVMSEQQALKALAAGQCNNAASIICLQWLQLNRDHLQTGLS